MTAARSLVGADLGGVRLVRLIAEGGMGQVYEGRQEPPRRTVAVTVVKPGIASAAAPNRFEFEAQVLARLRHPGIAQIHAAGVEEREGPAIPYFIMEYIPNAKPITRYADDLKLSTHQRLELFRRVCDAVAHGHQKGVIHRDLKPGNVLVDSSGQPKVIDFGVARTTDSDLALTTMQTDFGALVGTLQYMSPEQFDADPNDLDVRLDVYALGVVLYELLAGKLPYDLRQRAILEAARVVKETEPTPLSTIDRTLRRDVAVIAGKCLEKDRTRRYSSAAELGADLGRYLAGEPIAAVAPGLWDGLARLARRHRAAAAATVCVAASLVAAILGISVFAIRAARERDAADLVRVAAEEARAAAEEAGVREKVARDRAVRAREAAEGLVEFMTFTLRDKLLPLGRLDLMQGVLERLEQYHQDRVDREDAGDEVPDPEDLKRRGAFFQELGNLAVATGDLATARRHADRDLEVSQSLVDRDPGNARWQYNLAVSLDKLGDLDVLAGDILGARKRFESALLLKEAIAAREPANPDWQRALSTSAIRLGDLVRDAGDPVAARKHYERDLAIAEALAAAEPGNLPRQRDLAVSHSKLGTLDRSRGDFEGARRHHDAALAIREALVAADPTNMPWRWELAITCSALGDLAASRGDIAQSRAFHERDREICEALVAHDPANMLWRRSLSGSYSRLGDIARDGENLAEARDWYGKDLAITEALAAQDPANAAWQHDRATSRGLMGDLERAAGDPAAARGHYEVALEAREALVAQDPANARWLRQLAAIRNKLGFVAESLGDRDAAQEHSEKDLEISETLAGMDPTNAEWQ
ncbi:MAG: protein kinase domain-containing protein, partial [Planctomycetota bacterium]